MDATKEVQLRDELYKLLKTALMSYAEIQQSRFEALRKRMTERKPRTAPVKLDAPTLFVTGENDSITLAEDIAACAALFETATFYTITEADHLVFIERPTELAEVIIRFVHGIDFTQAPYLKQYPGSMRQRWPDRSADQEPQSPKSHQGANAAPCRPSPTSYVPSRNSPRISLRSSPGNYPSHSN